MDEALGNKAGVGRTLGNIGGIYHYQANYNEALKYYLKALEINTALDDKNIISANLVNIGSVYKQKGAAILVKYKSESDSGNYKKALDYYFKVLNLSEKYNDLRIKAANLGNIGSMYKDIGDLQRKNCQCDNDGGNHKIALEYFEQSRKLAEQLGDKRTEALNSGNMGAMFFLLKDYKKAEYYFNRSYELSKAIQSEDDIMQSHAFLSELYEKTGRHELALKHHKLFVAYKDSLNSAGNIKKQTQLEMQYGFTKKQQADSIRNAEATARETLKHDQEIKQQRIYTFGGALGFGLMLIIAGISFRAYRQKQKANEIISEQKMLVEEKQKEVMDSIRYAKRIQQSLMPTEKYISKKIENLKDKN
jgi:tetratricopeptide (TPR) repeat protein